MKTKTIKRNFFKYELWIGLAVFLVMIIAILLFYNRNNFLASAALGLTWIGSAIIFDFLYKRKSGRSIIQYIFSSKKTFFKVILVGISFPLIMEIFGLYSTRLWYFPYVPFYIYIPLAPILYVIYTIVLFIIYKYFKSLLNRFVKGGRPSKKQLKIYKITMNLLFILGLIGISACIYYSYINVSRFSIPIYEMTKDSNLEIPYWYVLILMPSLYIIVEYFNYYLKKETLIFDLVRGNFIPLIAIILANLLGIFFVEIINAPVQIWVYANWPLNDIRLFSIPILVILTWPGQFLLFLALFRLILDPKRIDIW